MKKARPLISSPKGTTSMKKYYNSLKKKYRKKERGKTKNKCSVGILSPSPHP
jgi:hypothetical protein